MDGDFFSDDLLLLLLHGSVLKEIRINNLLEPSAGPIKISHVIKHILSIVTGHLHASIVISKSRVGHLESLHGYGTDASQVGLVALALENCLLSQLDSILLLKLSDHRLQEFELILLLDHFGFDVDGHLLFHSFFVELVSRDFGIKFESFHSASKMPLVIELLTVLNLPLLSGLGLGLVEKKSDEDATYPFVSPLVDPGINNRLITIVLHKIINVNQNLPSYQASYSSDQAAYTPCLAAQVLYLLKL